MGVNFSIFNISFRIFFGYQNHSPFFGSGVIISQQSKISNPLLALFLQGVWIWANPIEGFTPDGEPIKILVLDTEGLGATDEE